MSSSRDLAHKADDLARPVAEVGMGKRPFGLNHPIHPATGASVVVARARSSSPSSSRDGG